MKWCQCNNMMRQKLNEDVIKHSWLWRSYWVRRSQHRTARCPVKSVWKITIVLIIKLSDWLNRFIVLPVWRNCLIKFITTWRKWSSAPASGPVCKKRQYKSIWTLTPVAKRKISRFSPPDDYFLIDIFIRIANL